MRMMPRIACLAATLVSLSPAFGAQRIAVADLAWLAGSWVEEKPDGWTEENWALPRAGVMLGTTLSGFDEQVADYEFVRIAADPDGTITYWASIHGKPPTPFRLVSAGSGSAAFENPTHDYPTRIFYRRDGDILTAGISGLNGARPILWTYRRR